MQKVNLETFFSSNGVAKKVMPNYSERPGQLSAANLIYENIESGKHTIVEGPCGFGKTFSYLVPTAHLALSDRKVLVVTSGITLQDQLIDKDLVTVSEMFRETYGRPLKFSSVKGKQNFICLRKLEDLCKSAKISDKMKRVIELNKISQKGEVSELNFANNETDPYLEGTIHSNISCISKDECLGNSKCPNAQDCWYTKQMVRAQLSDVIVTNYHLLFMNDITGGKLLPEVSAMIFDEGHEMAGIYRNLNEDAVYPKRINLQTGKLSRLVEDYPHLKQIFGELGTDHATFISAINTCSIHLEKVIHELSPKGYERMRDNIFMLEPKTRSGTQEILFNSIELASTTLLDLSMTLDSLIENEEDEDGVREMSVIISKISDTLEQAMIIVSSVGADEHEPEYAYYIEFSESQGLRLCRKLAFVGEEISAKIFGKGVPCVITSATLSSGGNFKFIKKELGLEKFGDNVKEFLGESPFDLENQQLWYFPSDIVDGNSPEFDDVLRYHVPKIIEGCMGGALFLSTSNKNMNQIAEVARRYISQNDMNIRVLKQGEMPRNKLIELFKEDTNSILVATKSMFTGVDIPGESLRCLCIDKLPFIQANDPVSLKIRQSDKSSFFTYEVPNMIMSLKQAVGRGVRTPYDKCALIFLDARMTSASGKSYAKTIGKSFEYSKTVTRDYNVFKKFFTDMGIKNG